MHVPSATRRALSNGVLRFSVVQSTISGFSIAPSRTQKNSVQAIENLSGPLDRARRVTLKTTI
jgi:hypothetical protein